MYLWMMTHWLQRKYRTRNSNFFISHLNIISNAFYSSRFLCTSLHDALVSAGWPLIMQVDHSLHKIKWHNKVEKDLHCSSRVFRKPPCEMVSTMGHKVIPHFESTFLYAVDHKDNNDLFGENVRRNPTFLITSSVLYFYPLRVTISLVRIKNL